MEKRGGYGINIAVIYKAVKKSHVTEYCNSVRVQWTLFFQDVFKTFNPHARTMYHLGRGNKSVWKNNYKSACDILVVQFFSTKLILLYF